MSLSEKIAQAQGRTYLFIIGNRNLTVRCNCQTIWLTIPLCFHKHFLRWRNAENTAIWYVYKEEVSRRCIYWPFEENILKWSSKASPPLRFLVCTSNSIRDAGIERRSDYWRRRVEIHGIGR